MDDSRVEGLEEVDYDRRTNTYRATFDGSSEAASRTVVSLLATVEDVDPMELEPLYSVVDPDALDALVTGPAGPGRRGATRVSFAVSGHEVTVDSGGWVVVEPGGEADTAAEPDEEADTAAEPDDEVNR